MAKMQGSLLQGVSGRVGQVVIYNRMGTWCVRRHVEHIRDRRSESQLECRAAFATLMRLASAMGDALAVGMRGEARQLGLVDSNLFLRLNKGCVTEGGDAQSRPGSEGEDAQSRPGGGGGSVDYGRLQVSAGPVATVRFTRVRVEDGVFEGRFERQGDAGLFHSADRVQVYLYCPEARGGYLSLPVLRMDRKIRFVVPGWMAGREVHAYAFCTACGDPTLASPTVGLDGLMADGSDHLLDVPDEGADADLLVAAVELADRRQDGFDAAVVDDGDDGVVHLGPGVGAAVGVAV